MSFAYRFNYPVMLYKDIFLQIDLMETEIHYYDYGYKKVDEKKTLINLAKYIHIITQLTSLVEFVIERLYHEKYSIKLKGCNIYEKMDNFTEKSSIDIVKITGFNDFCSIKKIRNKFIHFDKKSELIGHMGGFYGLYIEGEDLIPRLDKGSIQEQVDVILNFVNEISKLCGYEVDWDTDVIGCGGCSKFDYLIKT